MTFGLRSVALSRPKFWELSRAKAAGCFVRNGVPLGNGQRNVKPTVPKFTMGLDVEYTYLLNTSQHVGLFLSVPHSCFQD